MPYPGQLLFPPFTPGLVPHVAEPYVPGWRCIATRLNGDGTETPLDFNIPLQGLKYRDDLSGPGSISGTVTPEIPRLKQDEWFLPWSTALYVEESGVIRAGYILTKRTVQGPDMTLEGVGFTGYPVNQPYKGVRSTVYGEITTEFRHIWDHIQAQEGKNIGLVWDDSVLTDLTVGTPAEQNDFETSSGEQVSFESGPYKLNWWSTDDLGSELDKLAEAFDYQVTHKWDGEQIRHEGIIGYPTLGARLDHRIVVGENIFQEPQIDWHGDMYASEVVVLGSGEGRDMRRGTAARDTGRLGRTVTISDDSLTSNKQCEQRARRELKLRMGDPDISQIELLDHPHAPIGSVNTGDEIRVQTPHGWEDGIDLWVRVLSKETAPFEGKTVLDVARVERV